MKITIRYALVTYFDWKTDETKKILFLGEWRKVRDVKGLEKGYPVKIFNKTLKIEKPLEVVDPQKIAFEKLEKEGVRFDKKVIIK